MEARPASSPGEEVDLSFGREFAATMLRARHEDGAWEPAELVPFENLSLAPSCAALHYGQSIFEGMKAYRGEDGSALLFRPDAHRARMQRSARRLCMPEIPTEVFLDGIAELVGRVRDRIPDGPGHSLYVRPLCFATDACIGLRIGERHLFLVICAPVAGYHGESVSLLLSRENVRSHLFGTGDVKTAGNYAAGLHAAREARRRGCDDVLWVDAREQRFVEECGTMNVFFVLGERVVTPALDGTILPGITRDSVLHLLRRAGREVAERPVSIEELVQAHEKGELRECFGTGTAASVEPVARISLDGRDLILPAGEDGVAATVERELDEVRRGRTAGPDGWVVRV